jgi:RHS repeat-associated protein
MTNDGIWAYTYDAEGNVVKRSKGAAAETWVYGYDLNNRLVTAVDSATDGGAATARVTYVYDAIGNRIERLHWNGSVTVTERSAQDGWDTSKPGAVGNENFDVVLDLNSTNGLVTRRLYGDGQDDIIAKQSLGGVVTWYLTDHLGSVQSLLDNSGISVGTLAYSAFGGTTTNTGATDRYQYTGREWDAALGLQFNRDRMYLSSSGRWLSEDPSGFRAGDPNLMRYVGNGPTNGRDPSGMLEKPYIEIKPAVEVKPLVKVQPNVPTNDATKDANKGSSLAFGFMQGFEEGKEKSRVARLRDRQQPYIDFMRKENEMDLLGGVDENKINKRTTLFNALTDPAQMDRFIGELKLGKKLPEDSFSIESILGLQKSPCLVGPRNNRPIVLEDVSPTYDPDPVPYLLQRPSAQETAKAELAEQEKNKACFSRETQLWTPEGHRRIDSLKVGDFVYSRDEWQADGQVSPMQIEEVFQGFAGIFELVAGSHIIETTAEHPFFEAERGWTAANLMQPGDRVLCADGTFVLVDAIRDTGRWDVVYNVRVADFHTYFVGGDDWGFSVWAHNTCISIYKAPQPGLGATQQRNGWGVANLIAAGNGKLYFAKDRWIADTFAFSYGEGVIEILIDEDKYNSSVKRYEALYAGSNIHTKRDDTGIQIEVPLSDAKAMSVINQGIRIWHP